MQAGLQGLQRGVTASEEGGRPCEESEPSEPSEHEHETAEEASEAGGGGAAGRRGARSDEVFLKGFSYSASAKSCASRRRRSRICRRAAHCFAVAARHPDRQDVRIGGLRTRPKGPGPSACSRSPRWWGHEASHFSCPSWRAWPSPKIPVHACCSFLCVPRRKRSFLSFEAPKCRVDQRERERDSVRRLGHCGN